MATLARRVVKKLAYTRTMCALAERSSALSSEELMRLEHEHSAHKYGTSILFAWRFLSCLVKNDLSCITFYSVFSF